MQLAKYQKQAIRDKADDLFSNLKHMHPFPIDSPHIHAVYMSLVDPEIVSAVKTLVVEKNMGWLEVNLTGKLTIVNTNRAEGELHKYEIAFDFPSAVPSVNTWCEDKQAFIWAKHPMYDEILAWVKQCLQINADIIRCKQFINNLSYACNTAGQWQTVFPDFVLLLPDELKYKIARSKKRSPQPLSITTSYLREHRHFVAEKLATALLLPEDVPKIWYTS